MVRIRVPEGRRAWLTFMVDNGATVNLIKIGSLHPSTMVDTNQATPLIGINDQTVDTLGSVTISIRNRPVPFLVTMKDFPIEQDGVLGRDYLKKKQVVISYHYNALMIGGDVMHPFPFINPRTGDPVKVHSMEAVESCDQNEPLGVEIDNPEGSTNREEAAILEGNTPTPTSDPGRTTAEISPARVQYIIPKRTRSVIRINIISTGVSEGYLPRVDVGFEQVSDNTYQIMAINTRDEDVSIEVDPREILPFEYTTPDFEPGSDDDISVSGNNPITDIEDRIQKLGEIITTEHLNFEEKESVRKMIRDFPQIFLLPGDTLAQMRSSTTSRRKTISQSTLSSIDTLLYARNSSPSTYRRNLTTESLTRPTVQVIHPAGPKQADSQGNPR